MFKLELRFQNIVLKGFNIDDGETLTIGRDKTNDIPINDASISRLHACITRKGNKLTAHDKGSKSGILVNEEKQELVDLKNGDIVKIGTNHNLKVYIAANKKEPTLPAAHVPE